MQPLQDVTRGLWLPQAPLKNRLFWIDTREYSLLLCKSRTEVVRVERKRKGEVYFPNPTFSKYFISYSRMIPLGRSGSCQDKEMLFFAIFPLFTLVTGEGAVR